MNRGRVQRQQERERACLGRQVLDIGWMPKLPLTGGPGCGAIWILSWISIIGARIHGPQGQGRGRGRGQGMSVEAGGKATMRDDNGQDQGFVRRCTEGHDVGTSARAAGGG